MAFVGKMAIKFAKGNILSTAYLFFERKFPGKTHLKREINWRCKINHQKEYFSKTSDKQCLNRQEALIWIPDGVISQAYLLHLTYWEKILCSICLFWVVGELENKI